MQRAGHVRRRHTRIEKATAALNSSKYSLSRSLDRLECTFWCFGARCPGGTRKLTQAQYRATNIKQSTTQITPYVYAMGTLGLQCDVATKFRALKEQSDGRENGGCGGCLCLTNATTHRGAFTTGQHEIMQHVQTNSFADSCNVVPRGQTIAGGWGLLA